MNPLLFGHDPRERIVAAHLKDDSTMRLHIRNADGVRTEDERFFPFFYLSDGSYMDGFRRKHWMKKLDGNGFYQYLCAFAEWPVMWDAVRHVLDVYNRTALTKIESFGALEALYLFPDPVTQYLMQSGCTLFKGMQFDDVHRLQLDIETFTTPPHRFSNANREGDQIIIIALSDNRGWHHLIDARKLSERQMLQELVRIIREKDPDVIEGHNILNFDLPYITTRCAMHNVSFGIGRDGTPPRSFDARTSFAEHPFEYTATDVAGRHVIDTLLLVQSYDATKRNMESYNLKYVAKYFGFASADRTYIEGEKISWHWQHDTQHLLEYALDDVKETRLISAHLSGSTFYLTQMLPLSYGAAARSGSASKIETLLVREYLRLKHSLPRPQQGAQTSGGYTDIFLVGVLSPIVHADVESLYPSIMITRSIAPPSDVKQIFLLLLRELTTLRLDTKRTMRGTTEPQEKSRLDAMQSSFKILANSFYGYLGYARALFNDYGQADAVTQAGQQILRHMIGHIRTEGGQVIEVDTDGIFFIPPVHAQGEEGEMAFVTTLSRSMPAGISVAFDGRYRKMLSYKKKNYALLGYDDHVKIKGSSLISRSMEAFGRTYIRSCIDCLLKDDIAGLHELYLQYRQRIMDHKLDVREFARVESLKDSLGNYDEEVRSGKRNKSAAYEVARNTGRQVKPGDRIAFYISGNDPNARGFESAKPADEWNPNFPDENVPFYLRRLDEFSEKFRDLFPPPDFRSIFSSEGLFPFDPQGISMIVTDVTELPLAGKDEGVSPLPDSWGDE
jgi:DNA polymerase, archaea type